MMVANILNLEHRGANLVIFQIKLVIENFNLRSKENFCEIIAKLTDQTVEIIQMTKWHLSKIR